MPISAAVGFGCSMLRVLGCLVQSLIPAADAPSVCIPNFEVRPSPATSIHAEQDEVTLKSTRSTHRSLPGADNKKIETKISS